MMNSNPSAPILQLKDIHVSYGNYKALHGVDFDLYPGEIHGLVGEHRAGKSTLVKLISGAVRKERGHIFFNSREISSFTPQTAMKHKIGMMYQDTCNIIPTMDAVGNIFVGRDIRSWWIGLNDREMARQAGEIFARMGIEIDLRTPLKYLSEADQLMVELAKALSIDPDVLIFDEISSKLTPAEMEHIYKLLFDFKAQGKSVIYISHNMDEIFEVADRVTILKDGYRRGTEDIKELDKVKLMNLTYSYILSREELESDNRELYLLKKYNENIIKNLPDGVIILDPEHRVYLMNYAALRILELEEREMLRQNIATIFQPEAVERAAEILRSITSKTEQTWEELGYGENKVLKIHSAPFKDEDYKFLGTILIIEDVSKERYFQEYLLRTQKIASVAEVAAGVAHEINNPLGIIQNYITLLKRKTGERDHLEKFNKIEGELQRIVGIIGSLLSFSKRKKLTLRHINVVPVLRETLLLLNHKLQEKQIVLRWEDPECDIPIFGDENKLKQVFMNLLVNSIEAVICGGHIEIHVTICEDSRYVEIAISDDGYGIPEKIRAQIFDPFFSTKAGKKNTGLGLSICQHIIETHQGVLTCSNTPQTTFCIRLPLADEDVV